MLDYTIIQPENILVLNPYAPLSKEDFSDLSIAVDSHLADHPTLHGMLIHAKAFPGWESFGGFSAQMHFVSEYHKKIERVAIVTDSPIAGMAESLGNHFTSAEIKHFPFTEDAKALAWLEHP